MVKGQLLYGPPLGVTLEEWHALTSQGRSRLRRRMSHRCVKCNRPHRRDADQCGPCKTKANEARLRQRRAARRNTEAA